MNAKTKPAVAETAPPLPGNEAQPAPDFPYHTIDREALKGVSSRNGQNRTIAEFF